MIDLQLNNFFVYVTGALKILIIKINGRADPDTIIKALDLTKQEKRPRRRPAY